MIKIIRFTFFLLVLSLLIGLIIYVKKEEENEQISASSLEEMDLLQRYQDSLHGVPKIEQTDKETYMVTKIEDFEARVEQQSSQVSLQISKSNQRIFTKNLADFTFHQILSTDLNGDMKPEFWLLLKKGKNRKIFAFEYDKGGIKSFDFPALKGRQNFGYAGNDSLHVDKSYIVRTFDFHHDPYADLTEGRRSCYYSFGIDRSFVLNKTLDLEKIRQ
ncbi:hypothetical protein [Aquirufa sp. OSTEICH-129A]